MADGGWNDWANPPRPNDRDDADDDATSTSPGSGAPGEDESNAGLEDPESYESDWYRNLKSLAARTEALRVDEPSDASAGAAEDSGRGPASEDPRDSQASNPETGAVTPPRPGDDTNGGDEPAGLGPNPMLALFGELNRPDEGEDEPVGWIAPATPSSPSADPDEGSPDHSETDHGLEAGPGGQTSSPAPAPQPTVPRGGPPASSHQTLPPASPAETVPSPADQSPPAASATPPAPGTEGGTTIDQPPRIPTGSDPSASSAEGAPEPKPSLDSMDARLRRRALVALTERGLAASDVQRVLELAMDPDQGVRRQAIAALAAQADLLPDTAVLRALQDPIDQVRGEAVRLAARRGNHDLGSLLPLLGIRRAPVTQATALEVVPALVAQGDPIDDDLLTETLRAVAGLESKPNETERAPLTELARGIGSNRLLRMLEVSDDRRLGAVRLLSLEGSMAALRGLGALRNDPIEEVRITADQAIKRAAEKEQLVVTTTDEIVESSQVERAAESEMLTALARALEDPEDGVRSRARAALLDVDRSVIARWVRESLRSEDDEVARLAAEVARLLSLSEVAVDLLSRGASVQGERREPYRRVLSSLPMETEALVGALASVDPGRRPGAAQLVWIVAGRAALPLLQQSITDANPSVRIAVLHVLGDSGDASALETAQRVLASDSSPEVRVASIAVLVRAPADQRIRSLGQSLNDPDPTVRAAGVTRLPEGLGRETLGMLSKALEDLDERVWRAALPHLASFPADDVGFLWNILTSSRPEQRDGLVEALRQAEPSKLVALATEHAGALNAEEREIAMILAGPGGTLECVHVCVTSLQDPVVAVRRAAAGSLATLKSAAAVPALGASLQDPDPEVRIGALRALGVIDSEAVLGFLVQPLQDPSPEVRNAASAVLTEWSSPAVARRLAGVLATPALREPATALLKKMGPSAGELLVDVRLRSTAEMAPTIGRLLETIVGIETFASRLDSADPQQRRRAMIAISAIGGRRAVQLAEGMLADPDQHLRTAALEALADLGDPSTIDAIARVADSDPVFEVAETARWVLSRLQGGITSLDPTS